MRSTSRKKTKQSDRASDKRPTSKAKGINKASMSSVQYYIRSSIQRSQNTDQSPNILDDDKAFIKAAREKLMFALENSYTEKTNQTHSYTIKRFVKFATACGTPEHKALPCTEEMFCLFIANGVGRTGVGTANANIAAISAWHKSRGIDFKIPIQMQVIKRAIKLHWPKEKQQKPLRPPVTPAMMRALAAAWSDGPPRELCALALTLAAWTGQMRLGELVPADAKNVVRTRLPLRKHWQTDKKLGRASSITLPWTKTNLYKGDTVVLPSQKNPLDASVAVSHHILGSRLNDEALLCEYKVGSKVFILDKQELMGMCNSIWSKEGIGRITGHSFRIGGTTAYLMAGIEPSFVKVMGRWSSDAFLRYWRKLDELFTTHVNKTDFVDFDV
ncbi:hypothetical protein M408DRAFT_29036 [Serendipita vermifera MAFF 305830]|uniref:Core-binding (CB) domain-containing protein n=1 Tax=Serendipita vermifera MAFF 305830 TaxID=933852 RepID=A0A0C3APX9_SERVB|nr:hypothetical protein M408DRAFT_29036 [Serendipita vermifera MAFF 305830]